MEAFSSSPLTETFPPGRFDSPDLSPAASPARTEVDFPIDVDQSFNSSMTLSTSDSPPAPSPCMQLGKLASRDLFLASPTSNVRRRPDLTTRSYSALGCVREDESLSIAKQPPRPLGPARTFGRELSLNVPRPALSSSFSGLGKMLPPAVPEEKTAESSSSSAARRLVYNLSQEDMGSPKQVIMPRMNRRESAPTLESPCVARVAVTDRMDVDSPQRARPQNAFQSPSVHESPGLGSFFCESPAAPILELPPAKRRNIVSSSPASPSSSPSTRRPRCDKTLSSSALLFGAPRASGLATRRNAPYRRPPLQPVQPAEGPRSAAAGTQSAYPILYGAPAPRAAPAMRRAFSVCDQQPPQECGSEDEASDFDASPSVTSTNFMRYGGHSRLNSVDTSGSPQKNANPCRPSSHVERPQKPCAGAGLPGFGPNEVDGKILPCHKVKEDGLVRITSETMDRVLAGDYDAKMKRYHVLDCRFDYEFEGGHIEGAVNVRSMEQLDELVLQAQSGVNVDDQLPSPSCSGELECGQQVVLIFHCEFSAKRAPTFAKHLRSRDRTINNASYPKIHYPELYILEGGYSNFYQNCPTRCDPQAYVAMDDPRHFERRNSDLHDFRKFSRTRSFTYGEKQQPAQPRSQPLCPPMAFAAASFAVSRRGGTTIKEEEHEPDSSPATSNDSPCPRALSMGQAPIFGSAKSRAFQRAGFQRVASCTDAMVRN